MKLPIISKKNRSRDALSVIQTGKNNSQPFYSVERYVPLATPQIDLYREIREAVPIVDSAIGKLVRLVCAFRVETGDENASAILKNFTENIPVGGNMHGLDAFISVYFDELLTCGTAIGEIVLRKDGSFAGLYNARLEDVCLCRNENGFDIDVCTVKNAIPVPVEHPERIVFSALNPNPGNIHGNSLLKGLPFVSSILLKIFNTIGTNWERVGNVRFAVTYKPQNDSIDKAYAKDRAVQIASEWSKSMQDNSCVRDFVAVGDVSIKAIGADNQILDSEIPVKQMLEQIVAKTGLPPFMLGLSWSSTERMSSQQADVLTSELEYYRRILSPVITSICDTFLRLNGYSCPSELIWEDISLQDAVELSKARLYNAQAQQHEINSGEKNVNEKELQ